MINLKRERKEEREKLLHLQEKKVQEREKKEREGREKERKEREREEREREKEKTASFTREERARISRIASSK